MAKLHMLREGTGDARVASSFDVPVEKVKNLYGTSQVLWTARMPTFNQGPANSVSNPKVAVIELRRGESAFGSFRSPGFNVLKEADAMDVYKKLVEQKSS